jgi:hypothetical protein
VADRADARASALLVSTRYLFPATRALAASPKPLSPPFLPAETPARIQSAASGSVRDTERAAPTRRCSRHCGRTIPGACAPLSTLTRRRHVSCHSLLPDTPLVAATAAPRRCEPHAGRVRLSGNAVSPTCQRSALIHRSRIRACGGSSNLPRPDSHVVVVSRDALFIRCLLSQITLCDRRRPPE